AIPSTEAKARAWHVIVNEDELPLRFLAAAAKGFWQAEQHELTASYVARYFAEMPAMAARRTPHAARKVAAFSYPRYSVTAATLAQAQAMLAREDLEPTLRRVAIDATDELNRAWKARNHNA